MKITAIIIVSVFLLGLASFFFMGKASANGQAAGLVDGQLSKCSSKPNCVSSEAGTPEGKLIAPILSTHITAMKTAITDLGGVITSEAPDYISAEFTSNIFKFVDDFEVRMDGETAHMRSASRAGYSDRGVNAARADAVRAKVSS